MGIIGVIKEFFASIGRSAIGAIKEFFASIGRSAVEKLEKRRELLREELRVAEARFMKHRIDRKTYDEIVAEKQKQLVAIEVEIDALKVGGKIESLASEHRKRLGPRRQHILAELLREKGRLMKELALAKKKYFKREMAEGIYKEFVREKQKRLVEIEARVVQMYKDEAREIMARTEQELSKKHVRAEQMYTEELAEVLYKHSDVGEWDKARGRRRMWMRKESGKNKST